MLSRRADLVLDEDDNDGGLQATRPRAPRSGARAPGKGGARGGGRVLTQTARRASLFFVRRSRSATSPTRGSRPHPRQAARRAAGALGARAPRTTTERLRGGGRGAGRARGRARVQRDVACSLRARERGRGPGTRSGPGRPCHTGVRRKEYAPAKRRQDPSRASALPAAGRETHTLHDDHQKLQGV